MSYYPQIIDNVEIDSDTMAVKYLNINKTTIVKYRKLGVPLSDVRDIVYKAKGISKDASMLGYFDGTGYMGLDDFLAKENSAGIRKDVVRGWILRGADIEKIKKMLHRVTYPYTYEDKTYNSDLEVAEAFGLSEDMVAWRRRHGYTFSELILPKQDNHANPNPEKNGYPFTADGRTANTDRELAEMCGKDIQWVRNRRRYGWTPSEMYYGDAGVPKGSPVTKDRVTDSNIYLCGFVWYPSLSNCLDRLGLSEYKNRVSSFSDKEEGIGRAFVHFAKKYNEGYITPDLLIDHPTHEHEGEEYYCCYLDGEVEYLNSKQILEHRLRYIKFDLDRHNYRNNGVFNLIKYAEAFYAIGNNSIRRKSTKENISLEEATIKLITENSKKGNGYESDDRTYRYLKDIARKEKINYQTLMSRIQSGNPNPLERRIVSVDLDIWQEGAIVGKKHVEYKSYNDLYRSLGIVPSSAITYMSNNKDVTHERYCNDWLYRENFLWLPYVNKCYKSLSEISREFGLDFNRLEKVKDIAIREGIRFWDALRFNYITERNFKKRMGDFTVINGSGNLFYLKGILRIADPGKEEPKFHCINFKRSLIVCTFSEIFAILCEYRVG